MTLRERALCVALFVALLALVLLASPLPLHNIEELHTGLISRELSVGPPQEVSEAESGMASRCQHSSNRFQPPPWLQILDPKNPSSRREPPAVALPAASRAVGQDKVDVATKNVVVKDQVLRAIRFELR